MWQAITQIFRAVAEALGLVNRRTDLKNQADVKEAAKAQQAVDVRNEIETSTAKKEVDETRNDLAE